MREISLTFYCHWLDYSCRCLQTGVRFFLILFIFPQWIPFAVFCKEGILNDGIYVLSCSLQLNFRILKVAHISRKPIISFAQYSVKHYHTPRNQGGKTVKLLSIALLNLRFFFVWKTYYTYKCVCLQSSANFLGLYTLERTEKQNVDINKNVLVLLHFIISTIISVLFICYYSQISPCAQGEIHTSVGLP